jgi:hypothetical protein
MGLPRIKYGDVFKIITTKGFGYFQCVKETSAKDCEVIRILPGVYKEDEIVDIGELVEKKELYFIQFPLKYAVKKKCVKCVANCKVPESVIVPKYYRDKHIVRGEFISWHIIDSETFQIHSVEKLSDDEKRLSPAEIWNDTLLAERIAEGWTLDKWV